MHKALNALARVSNPRLVRIYSQNIDGLERKAGLECMPDQMARDTGMGGTWGKEPECILMHGEVGVLKCNKCHKRTPAVFHHAELSQGRYPQCNCTRASNLRELRGLMKYCILLYNDTSPNSEDIAEYMTRDLEALGRARNPLLMVVGTRATISDIQQFIKKVPTGVSVWINPEDPPAALKFTHHVKGDCQSFGEQLLAYIQRHHRVNIQPVQRHVRPLWDAR